MRSRLSALLVAAVAAAVSIAAAAPNGDGIVRSGPPACKAIALTFDLCPVREGSGFDAPLVQELIAHRIHATFFPSGLWIAAHDAQLRQLLAVPFFEIGTHGQVHARLTRLSKADQRRELLGPVETLEKTYGRRATLFRPPYGLYDEDTLAVARETGQRMVLWSVVSGDPDPKLTAAGIERDVEWRVRPGSLVIFHANGRGWHTAEIVEHVYENVIAKKGWATATVSELLAGCTATHDDAVQR